MTDQPTTATVDDTIVLGPAAPLWDAIVALDALAVTAGIPDPGSTVRLPPEAYSIALTKADEDGTLAEACLRRAAAWANALVDALPERP